MPGKQQFNTVLPLELVRRIKHHSIDVQLSLSDLATQVFEAYLSAREDKLTDHAGAGADGETSGLRLQPMVHVRKMSAAVEFYERLGGQLVHGSRDGDWVLMRVNGDADGRVLVFDRHEWECFLDGARQGEFDDAIGPAAP